MGKSKPKPVWCIVNDAGNNWGQNYSTESAARLMAPAKFRVVKYVPEPAKPRRKR